MYRCSVLYGTPADPAAFDDYYRDVHIPLAQKMKGLTGWDLTWTSTQEGDLQGGVYLVADLYAESQQAMDEILASSEGRAASADVLNFATGGTTFLFGEVEKVSLT